MSRVALSALLAFAAVAVAQNPTGTQPLTDKHFSYPTGLPEQADPNDGVRGPQSGYNICNSTTEGPNSLCQTGFINSIDDWCVWAPATGPTTIGESEGQEVAWCTKAGRGTRLIPAGAITGVQFLRAPSYLEVIAFLDQTMLNMEADDFGGELDPHGADLRGNPIGGLLYSNNLPQSGNGDNSTFIQVEEWHNFIGSNLSCFKACDPKDPNAGNYCYNRLDRVGIPYVCPNSATNGTFEMCDSDNQLFPGVYVTNGVTTSYTQPPDSVAIGTLPYTASIPSSSNCVTYQSSDLFASLPTPSGASSAASTSGASAKSGSGSGSGSGTPSRTGSSSTGTPSATGGAQNSGAGTLRTSAFTTIAGVVFAVAFFA